MGETLQKTKTFKYFEAVLGNQMPTSTFTATDELLFFPWQPGLPDINNPGALSYIT